MFRNMQEKLENFTCNSFSRKLVLIQDAAMSPNDDYSMPHWINLSFYSKNQRVGYSHFKSRINIPRRTEAQIRQNRQNAQIENIKHEDHVSNR